MASQQRSSRGKNMMSQATRERKSVHKLFHERHHNIQQPWHDAVQANIKKEEEGKRQELQQLQGYTDATVSHG